VSHEAVEVVVRMGEYAVSDRAEDVLLAIGLGSCVGLVLVEAGRRRAGLAHVVLPQAPPGAGEGEARFADRAVPLLVGELERLGAGRGRLQAVLVGGAQMFSFDKASEPGIGARNVAAARRALQAAGIAAAAQATLGGRGRTVRVDLAGYRVSVKEAGGRERTLHRWGERQ
jgi:chemotaxis protein CheD